MNINIITLISEIGYHGATGAIVAYLIGHRKMANKNVSKLLLFGFLAGLLPDLSLPLTLVTDNATIINNFYLYGHSLFVAPSLSLGLAIVSRSFLPETKLSLLWVTLFLSLLIGHLFMDFLDNGLSLLYPLIDSTDIGLNILTGSDGFIVIPFLILIVLLGSFQQTEKKKWQTTIIIIGLCITTAYIGLRGYSKIQLQNQLDNEFPNGQITLEPTSGNPFTNKQWTYVVDSGYLSISGEASFSNVSELKRELRTHSGPKLLLKEISVGDEKYFISTQSFIDENVEVPFNYDEESLYVYQLNQKTQNLELVDEGTKGEILAKYDPF
ncbi:metal-dependent hydrolase [Bacillus spongiae]|uniref:Metal-dependent hydrolase n=1 Tax=Bacillus spongiae TaxID=2683610 RepID=A0ABU8HIW4_9BACI